MNVEASSSILTYDDQYLDGYFDCVGLNPDFYARSIVLERGGCKIKQAALTTASWDPSFSIVQFWDTPNVPPDVLMLIDTWKNAVPAGCHILVSDDDAKRFIVSNYGEKFIEAYEYCSHPAMKSDYFRLAYLYANGGFYADADERLEGELPYIDFKARDFLIASLLIREREKNLDGQWQWLTIEQLRSRGLFVSGPVCYFNNNILVTNPRNPVIKAALMRATRSVLKLKKENRVGSPHLYTGPTCLTFSVSSHFLQCAASGANPSEIYLIYKGQISTGCRSTMVELSYKKDHRNWKNV